MPHWSSLVAYAAVLTLGAISSATDLKTGKVYNQHTYTFALAGLVLWSVAGFFCASSGHGWAGAGEGFSRAGLGLLAGFLPCMILHFLFGLGMGDAKCLGAMGALFASWESVLGTAFYGLIAGIVTSLVVLARRGQLRAVGRNMGLIAMQAAAVQRPEVHSQHPVPFCLPLAIGAALSGAEQLLGLTLPWSHLSPHAPAWIH